MLLVFARDFLILCAKEITFCMILRMRGGAVRREGKRRFTPVEGEKQDYKSAQRFVARKEILLKACQAREAMARV